MNTPATVTDVTRLLAVRDLREAHRKVLAAHGDLKRSGAPDDALAEIGQAAHHLGRALAAIAKVDRPPSDRPHKPEFRPLTESERRERAETRILERLRRGSARTVLLARHAGREAIGYDVARRVMDDLLSRGVVRVDRHDQGRGQPATFWTLA
jgi:hypothetical protein